MAIAMASAEDDTDRTAGSRACKVRVCQGCVKGVSRVCQGCVKGVSRLCQGCVNGV